MSKKPGLGAARWPGQTRPEVERYHHVVEPWTVGRLRAALARVPGHLLVVLEVADEAGGDSMHEQAVIDVAVGGRLDADEPVPPTARHARRYDEGRGHLTFRLAGEFPSGTYDVPENPWRPGGAPE